MRCFISFRCLAALLLLLPGCTPAAPPAPPAAHSQETRYYVGSATTTSPDGAQPYGPPLEIAARRVLDSAAGTIEEDVVHPGRAYPTRLRRRAGDGAVFTAEDEAGSFSGTVSFAGPAWAWTTWTYDITMRDGSGALRGTGRAGDGTIDTDKLFVGPDGEAKARIREHLEEVDASTFARTRDALLARPPARPPPAST